MPFGRSPKLRLAKVSWRCFHMCCVSKQSVDLGMLSWLFFFLIEAFFSAGRNNPSKASHLTSSHNLRFWLHHTTHGLLDLPEESGFWEMFNKKLPNWELPTGRLTSHFGYECGWKLRHAPCCTNRSEKHPPPKGLWTTVWLHRWQASDVLALITLQNRADKEAFALLQQPFWLSANGWSVTDEAGHGEKQKKEDWELRQSRGSRSRHLTRNLLVQI